MRTGRKHGADCQLPHGSSTASDLNLIHRETRHPCPSTTRNLDVIGPGFSSKIYRLPPNTNETTSNTVFGLKMHPIVHTQSPAPSRSRCAPTSITLNTEQPALGKAAPEQAVLPLTNDKQSAPAPAARVTDAHALLVWTCTPRASPRDPAPLALSNASLVYWRLWSMIAVRGGMPRKQSTPGGDVPLIMSGVEHLGSTRAVMVSAVTLKACWQRLTSAAHAPACKRNMSAGLTCRTPWRPSTTRHRPASVSRPSHCTTDHNVSCLRAYTCMCRQASRVEYSPKIISLPGKTCNLATAARGSRAPSY